jgi:hypothetical protein
MLPVARPRIEKASIDMSSECPKITGSGFFISARESGRFKSKLNTI